MESNVKVQAMYSIEQSSTIFNSFNSKLCMKQIFSEKKKFVSQVTGSPQKYLQAKNPPSPLSLF